MAHGQHTITRRRIVSDPVFLRPENLGARGLPELPYGPTTFSCNGETVHVPRVKRGFTTERNA